MNRIKRLRKLLKVLEKNNFQIKIIEAGSIFSSQTPNEVKIIVLLDENKSS